MGLFGDIVGAGEEFLTGANTAPTPQVNSKPPGPVEPKQWSAPDVNADGHITVHRDHLTQASDVLKAHLTDIRDAISQIQQQYGSFDCLQSWPQGQTMCQNLMSMVESFAQVTQDTHDAHAAAASNLAETASTYEQAETSNTKAAQSAGSGGGGGGGGGGSWS